MSLGHIFVADGVVIYHGVRWAAPYARSAWLWGNNAIYYGLDKLSWAGMRGYSALELYVPRLIDTPTGRVVYNYSAQYGEGVYQLATGLLDTPPEGLGFFSAYAKYLYDNY